MTETSKTVGRKKGGVKDTAPVSTEVVEKEQEVKFELPQGKLIAAPIKRVRKGNPVSHETSFKFKGATEKIRLPFYNVGGRKKFANPFSSNEEQKYLEKQIGEDLNIFNPKNSFFNDFYVELGGSLEEFDLSDPVDYLSSLVLKANKDVICNDPSERLGKATYKWILSEDGFQESEKDEMGERKIVLYAYMDKIKNNRDEMMSFLTLRNLRPPSNATDQWLRGKVYEEIEANPTQSYILVTDSDKDVKMLFEKALQTNAITYMKDRGYIIKGKAIPFAENKMNAIEFLKNKTNQEAVIEIKANIKDYLEK